MNVGTARTWDVENRLTSITKDSVTTTFVYDGDGSRIKKTVGSTTTIYVNQYYEKNLTAGEATTSYYLGGKLVAQRAGSTLSYLLQDHLGSTSVTYDPATSTSSTIKYFSFGSVRSTTGALPTDKKFTGQRLDATGLYYYGARYYDATIGRFISADTIVPNPANPQSLNRYSYCYNNPLRYVDPTGHEGDDDNDDDGMTLDEYMYYIQNGFNTYSQQSENYGKDAWVDEVFDGIGKGIINTGIGIGKTVLEPGQVLRETWNAIRNYDDTWTALLNKWSTTEGKAELGTEAELGLLLAKYLPKGRSASITEFPSIETLNASEAGYIQIQANSNPVITGFTRHGINQLINREVSPQSVLDTVKNPLIIAPQPNGTLRYIGKEATVVLNADGIVVTVWRK
jgi:RHS repeat-associated protein